MKFFIKTNRFAIAHLRIYKNQTTCLKNQPSNELSAPRNMNLLVLRNKEIFLKKSFFKEKT
jgi:hypothetical protein